MQWVDYETFSMLEIDDRRLAIVERPSEHSFCTEFWRGMVFQLGPDERPLFQEFHPFDDTLSRDSAKLVIEFYLRKVLSAHQQAELAKKHPPSLAA